MKNASPYDFFLYDIASAWRLHLERFTFVMYYYKHTSHIYHVSFSGILTRRFRTICYKNKQPNCTEKFIDVYPELSKSANNLSVAETHFWLFTNKNQNKPEWLDRCGGDLPPKTNFNPKNDLIVIISPYIAGICEFAVYRVSNFREV